MMRYAWSEALFPYPRRMTARRKVNGKIKQDNKLMVSPRGKR